ncbi:transcriptional regulator [Porphyromonas macacae]|uniref:Staphylococcal respiratory response protein A n=1 Tax=Porphyromonas macacae TaxID=28115 RepID=A0A379DKP2_9PORP|nr:response regulator transcription factor [Porphyromonas macacae]KGN99523.1 transcriptional regulator [Porphyromonas macacae]SUB78742.1 Staphylococcal respiratory response protein A [Porphyromonas macacae]
MDEHLKVLLCEDDESLGFLLKEFLEVKDFTVDLFTDGQLGADAFSQGKYDICILDVMMPRMDGFELAVRIREQSRDVPIIFLSAKSMKADILKGFHVGADDYMTKPFSMEELLLRIEAIIRRTRSHVEEAGNIYYIGKYVFDSLGQTLTLGEKVTKLTTKESALLFELCKHVNVTLERSYAMTKIWPEENYFNARSIDVYVTKLRKMLKDDPSVSIKNVHGRGYKLVIPSGVEN